VNILDTDALSHHMKMNSIGGAIDAPMKAASDPQFGITSINAFEMVDGALALYQDLRKKRKDLILGFRLIPSPRSKPGCGPFDGLHPHGSL
jgi:hypothetical protein